MPARDLIELENFVAVADLLGFAAAAARLGVTPSAVSQTIRQLEQRIGERLFVRTTRSVALTRAGERLASKARPALDAVAEAYGTLAELDRTPRGRLRLTLSQIAAEQLVVPALPAFVARFPEVEVELSVDNDLVDLVSERFDAGIRRGELLNDDVVASRLGPDDRLVTVASPAYFADRSRPVHPRDLHDHACIRLRSRGTGLLVPWTFRRDGATITIKPSGPLIVDDPSIARAMAVAGIGIARLARSYVQASIDSGALRPVLAKWSDSLGGFFLFYRRELRTFPALRAFQQFMIE